MSDYLDDLIRVALKRRKRVELYLCSGVEGGYGIKIDGKVVSRNRAWEDFEEPVERERLGV